MKNKDMCVRQKVSRQLQLHVFYGWKCAECGDKRIDVLHLHHKDGGGAKRRKDNSGDREKRDLLKKAKKGVLENCEILCANCHTKRHRNRENKVLFSIRCTKNILKVAKVRLEDFSEWLAKSPSDKDNSGTSNEYGTQQIADYLYYLEENREKGNKGREEGVRNHSSH